MPLTIRDAGFTFGPGTSYMQRALEGVSLEVSPGELVLVLGATGSGKSTLLRVACGLLDAESGSASIDGEALSRSTARGAVGLVFQDAESQLFADSVLDDVAFGPRNLGLDAEEASQRARSALTAVGLDPDTFGSRSPFALSGGEARRAAIAGVLAMRPRYLLADEPTAGLDAAGRRVVRDVLLAQREGERAGVLVVSHSAEEFLGDANRVLVLAEGRSAWYGPAAELVADPSPLLGAGLVAPAVLEVQRLARERGLETGAFTLDPVEAAERLAAAGGWT